ncbi:MAG: hypothetical protein D6766_12805 [Verrucomicrobia bacterium]|nr:MAG: hypothetical protein D6766_12805 [Verrucomicrobiota bacterium]
MAAVVRPPATGGRTVRGNGSRTMLPTDGLMISRRMPEPQLPGLMNRNRYRSMAWIGALAAGVGMAVAGGPALPQATALGPLPHPFRAPARLATDAAGRLYVADAGAGKLLVFDLATRRVVAGKDGLSQPLGVAVDSAGRVYVGEAGPGRVTVFDLDWRKLGVLGAGSGEFQLPNYIAVDEDGGTVTVHVSDSAAHVVKSYVDGVLVRTLGGPAAGSDEGEFDFPAGLWVSPGGELHVVDQNNHRIQVFDRAGSLVRVFRIDADGLGGRVQGICGDAHGRLFVADTFQGFVRVFDATGRFLGHVGEYGTRPGHLRSPAGVAVDAAGQQLTVASLNTARVELFGLDQAPMLTVAPTSDGRLVLTWNAVDQTLETAPEVTGPWAPLAGATSPYEVEPDPSKPAAFFRLRSDTP